MSRTKLLVIGAGGYARSVAEAATATGEYTVAGFVDDRWPDLPPIGGVPVLGRIADLPSLRANASTAIFAIGNNARRRQILDLAVNAGFNLVSIVHPRAIVSQSAVVGQSVTVMAGAVIGCEARLADGALVGSGAVVDHHCELDVAAHVGAGACMAGGSSLGPGAWLQEGCALRPGQKVDAGVVISTTERTGS